MSFELDTPCAHTIVIKYTEIPEEIFQELLWPETLTSLDVLISGASSDLFAFIPRSLRSLSINVDSDIDGSTLSALPQSLEQLSIGSMADFALQPQHLHLLPAGLTRLSTTNSHKLSADDLHNMANTSPLKMLSLEAPLLGDFQTMLIAHSNALTSVTWLDHSLCQKEIQLLPQSLTTLWIGSFASDVFDLSDLPRNLRTLSIEDGSLSLAMTSTLPRIRELRGALRSDEAAAALPTSLTDLTLCISQKLPDPNLDEYVSFPTGVSMLPKSLRSLSAHSLPVANPYGFLHDGHDTLEHLTLISAYAAGIDSELALLNNFPNLRHLAIAVKKLSRKTFQNMPRKLVWLSIDSERSSDITLEDLQFLPPNLYMLCLEYVDVPLKAARKLFKRIHNMKLNTKWSEGALWYKPTNHEDGFITL